MTYSINDHVLTHRIIESQLNVVMYTRLMHRSYQEFNSLPPKRGNSFTECGNKILDRNLEL